MREIKLSNGAHVRVRPMTPHIIVQFRKNVTLSLPAEPQPPTRTVKMIDGHIEPDTISPDSPEWREYEKERAKWERACDDVMVDANDNYNNLQRDYSVEEWSFDGENWHKDVPHEWVFPQACVRAGIQPCGNERVDYIGIELLTTWDDWDVIRAASEGETSTILDEEAARVRAGFQTGDRQKRDASTAKNGWLRRLALKISRGNAGGKGVGVDA